MHRLHTERGEDFGSAFTDPWADDFLLNCIGTEMLMSQQHCPLGTVAFIGSQLQLFLAVAVK